MKNSKIVVCRSQTQKFIFYTCLLAAPSTGKSTILNAVSKPLYEIEKVNGISLHESHIANPGTVEAAISILRDRSYLFSMYDESSAFFGSLGI